MAVVPELSSRPYNQNAEHDRSASALAGFALGVKAPLFRIFVLFDAVQNPYPDIKYQVVITPFGV
jgi:hypothetical protein